jgi:hypothetical protein
MKLCLDKGLNLIPMTVFSTMTKIQLTKCFSAKQFLAQKLIIEMEQPPYSPDLALNGFCYFQK